MTILCRELVYQRRPSFKSPGHHETYWLTLDHSHSPLASLSGLLRDKGGEGCAVYAILRSLEEGWDKNIQEILGKGGGSVAEHAL